MGVFGALPENLFTCLRGVLGGVADGLACFEVEKCYIKVLLDRLLMTEPVRQGDDQ